MSKNTAPGSKAESKATDTKASWARPDRALSKENSPAVPQRVDANRADAVADLYAKHWKDLCNWLRRRFGEGPPEPEDLAQTAFERFAALEDIDAIRDERAFLYTVAARCAVDGLRSRDVMRRYVDDALADHGREVGEITPEHVYLVKEEIHALSEDLRGLSDKQRETVIRSRFLGQSYEQIAADTGWSTSAISRYLRAAMETLSRNAEQRRAASSPETSRVAHGRRS